jgi:hypothetical protein
MNSRITSATQAGIGHSSAARSTRPVAATIHASTMMYTTLTGSCQVSFSPRRRTSHSEDSDSGASTAR